MDYYRQCQQIIQGRNSEKLIEWYNRTILRIEQDRQSDAEVARVAEMTLAEYDADVTADDPRETPAGG